MITIYPSRFMVAAIIAMFSFAPSCRAEPFTKAKVDYIKRHYEHRLFSKRHIFFGNAHPTSMVVFFMQGDEDAHIDWEWFWQDKRQWGKTAYLFIYDEQQSWFLGKGKNAAIENYTALIDHYVTTTGLAYNNIVAAGGAMGGYGAIFYATLLGFHGAVVINPDVSEHVLGEKKLKHRVGDKWRDLDVILDEHPHKVHVSLIFGSKDGEQDGGYALLDRLQRKNITTVIRRYTPYTKNNAASFITFLSAEFDYLLKQRSLLPSRCIEDDIDDFNAETTRLDMQRFSPEKIQHIKDFYEHTLFDKQHLFYPAKKAKRLVVFFSGAVPHRYAMWSWFWQDDESWQDTAYLFVRDDALSWYLGNNERSFVDDYKKLITYYMEEMHLSKQRVYTVGGSMGGYGALLYATLLQLGGALVLNPQINKEHSGRFAIENAQDCWLELDQIIAAQVAYVPHLSLSFSFEKSDQGAGYALIDTYKNKMATMTIKRDPSIVHTGASIFTRSFIEEEIAYLEQQYR